MRYQKVPTGIIYTVVLINKMNQYQAGNYTMGACNNEICRLFISYAVSLLTAHSQARNKTF
jgi:hypothetical protein